MALWQVGFFILPKASLKDQNSFEVSDEHFFDDAKFWLCEHRLASMFNSVSNFLPKSKSWADYLILYGDENSNRLEVIIENNYVESVSFRIDFTSNYEDVLSQIIEFCILNGLIILDESLNIVPLNLEVAKSIIEEAPQVKKYNQLLNNKDQK